jgi:cytochrome c-type biogenesis protein CcmH/NrfG
MEAVQKEMSEAINKATADHELRMRQLQDRVDAMERGVLEVVSKNKEEEQRMRKEKSRMEAALNEKIAQYDEDMAARLDNSYRVGHGVVTLALALVLIAFAAHLASIFCSYRYFHLSTSLFRFCFC